MSIRISTRQEAKALGIVGRWPTQKPPSDGMNKLERAFWQRLQEAQRRGEFIAVMREPITLRLAGRTTYKPDFMTIDFQTERTVFWEVKGFMRDDAAVKLKVAASSFPWFSWILVQRIKDKWQCKYVTEHGFSIVLWCPKWLR